ncbi:Hypothetical protein (Fragment) [Durusdinium trenchii]|uniref:GATA-type domain-containing protein n=1 Tax=Durusdinium trenchii TaxID=1381693 RepID=A0ABP0K6A9_9DINO
MAIAEDRIRMECDKCGYKCVPQWLNDRAHCLKCQAVLRSRGSVHEAKREIFGAEANGETRRSCGEASTFKVAPGSAMESASGICSKAPDGVHHWKYGKCNFCQVPEGKLAKGPGVMANPGGAAECEKGGKCMFKFAKCTKCGRGECGMAGPDSRRSSTTSTASSENAARVVPVTKPRPQSPTLAAAALVVKETKSEEEEVSQKTSKEAPRYEATKASAGTGDDRTRVTCHVCGYKSVPQWLNDKAHCLKCDAILKTRSSIHGDPDMPENILKDLSSGRAPGEASTYKQAPGSAMESASGSCSKAPDGIHHWKYGKCNFCQQPEGKLVKGSGVIANPGGAGGCSKDGGKCMFKFSKCTKCGRREI